MEELNAFNDDGYVGDAVAAIVTAVVGIFVVVIAAWALPKVGIALSWLLIIGGVAVAVTSPQHRPVASGLVFAGAAPPVAVFLFFWVWISGGVLFG